MFCCLQSAKMNQRHMRPARKYLKNLVSRFAMSRSNSWDTNSRGAVQRLATIVSNAVEITRIFERFCYHSCPSLCLNNQTTVTSRAVAVTLTLLTFSLFTTFGFTFCLLIKPTIILYSGGESEMSCRRTRDCCWDRFTPRGRVSCPGKKN